MNSRRSTRRRNGEDEIIQEYINFMQTSLRSQTDLNTLFCNNVRSMLDNLHSIMDNRLINRTTSTTNTSRYGFGQRDSRTSPLSTTTTWDFNLPTNRTTTRFSDNYSSNSRLRNRQSTRATPSIDFTNRIVGSRTTRPTTRFQTFLNNVTEHIFGKNIWNYSKLIKNQKGGNQGKELRVEIETDFKTEDDLHIFLLALEFNNKTKLVVIKMKSTSVTDQDFENALCSG